MQITLLVDTQHVSKWKRNAELMGLDVHTKVLFISG